MPSTMIHLWTAHEVAPDAPDFYWVGNFAPDYENDREKKDKIHLRRTENRWDLLAGFYASIDHGNPFERGWFMHLFTDTCWDESQIPQHRDWYAIENDPADWFTHYREEIGYVTFHLYHTLPWSKDVWEQINSANLSGVKTTLPILPSENQWYRDRVASKHAQSNPDERPKFFTVDHVESFVQSTAGRYSDWIKSHS